MKKILLSFAIQTIVLSSLSAQQRNVEQAENIASFFVSNSGSRNNIRAQKSLSSFCYNNKNRTIEKYSNATRHAHTPFYIFSDSTSSTFVIVSGDERMKKILASGDMLYSGKTCEIPEGLAGLLESYRQQYELLQAGAVIQEETTITIDIPDVQPLIKSKWHQGSPYNNLCPTGCPSGCVATAMSQVMNYHKYPESGHGDFSYITHTKRLKCSYDFEKTAFKWDKLRNTYPKSTLGEISGAEEIAQVTYACGVSVGMDYNTDGSGAYMSDVPYALIHFFDYNKNVSYRDRTCYNATEWYGMLCKELEEGRPVIYGGVDSRNGGHAFVIEGCSSRTRKFYINWGWGGDFDGEYELDALDPGTYRFSSYQSMIVNVSPQLVGEYEDVFYADRFISSKEIGLNKDINFTLQDVYCYASQSSYVVSNAKFRGEIGVAIFDKDFEYISTIDKKDIDGLNNFDGYDKLSFSAKLTKSMFPEGGTYYIAPYVEAKSSQRPTRIRTTGGRTDYIVVTLGEDDINGNTDDDNPEETITAWNEDFEYTAVPKGWSQETVLGESLWNHRYVLQPSSDMPIAAKGKGYISLEYATSMQDRYNTRTVTRLETGIIPLSEENVYELSLQYRKYATLPESTDLLTVYYEKDGNWHILSEIPVMNQGEWTKASINLPVSGSIRLAFEGSPAKGSFVFLDDLLINEQSTSNLSPLFGPETSDHHITVYSLEGRKVAVFREDTPINILLKDGVYIIQQFGDYRKIFIKNAK